MDGLFREEVIAHRADRSLGQVTLPSGHLFAPNSWVPFFGRASMPVILQAENAECGLACLAMVAAHHGLRSNLGALRRRWSVTSRGATLAHLMSIAQDMELSPRALRVELGDLGRVRCPAVLHWNLDHFVVLERLRGQSVSIIDPASGRRTVTLDEVSKSFTGVVLELEPTPAFKPRQSPVPLSLGSFFTDTIGLAAALGRLLGLSLILQAFVLVAPLFTQLVIDNVVVTGDTGLLTLATTAFLALAAIQVGISGMRGWFVVLLGADLRLAWSARLFHHLLRLPLAWFERRHVGDVVSRFGSLRAIENLVTSSVVEAVVDGMMALTTLAVMVYYSVELTLVAAGAVALYALARAALMPAMRRVADEALTLEAREHSVFMESVRAIAPLKNFGREGMREARWRNEKSASLRAGVRAARLQLIQRSINGIVFAGAGILVLWAGAHAVIAGALTVGMLVAFMAFQHQFTTRTAALVDRVMQLRLARVHLDRIADIALADRDVAASDNEPEFVAQGAISTRGLSYRYADTEPWVINELDLDIVAGECVAIAAPSGTGKSTLVKLLLGLLAPSDGQVLVDGKRLHGALVPAWRRQVGVVLQDDVLLSGTLADNVACFEPIPDQYRLDECARLAAIDGEISALPMGWYTRVGDMGSALSGGQRQRLLLARALYATPRVVFLDEATSHLDPATESRIHEALRNMHMTRVLVAHRRETLAIADRVIELRAA